MARQKTPRNFRRWIWLLALVVAAGLLVAALRVGPEPQIDVQSDLPGIGKSTTVRVVATEPSRGLGDVRVEVVQGDRTFPIAERPHRPLPSWSFSGERTAEDAFEFEVGSATLPELREGEATIRVTVGRAGAWLRRPAPAVAERTLPVKLRPPALSVISSRTYVTQGGSEAVVYRVGLGASESGVQAGDWWFPGYPLPGGAATERFALFGAPYDLDDPERIRLVARDDVGNETALAFIDRFQARPLTTDTIPVSEGFLSRVVPPILDRTTRFETSGDLLEDYVRINRDLRRRNAETLIELSAKTVPEFLWRGRFLRMRNAAQRSGFAERRSYRFEGREIDRQDHLGLDLASVRRAEIEASNAGIVLLAQYFGIYGNAVLIDHGYGLLSLYGHLSSLDVTAGQTVEKGEVIGRSGQTGLAGGDHLHFTMLLRGLAVDPREWWDDHWIQDRLRLKLGDALPEE